MDKNKLGSFQKKCYIQQIEKFPSCMRELRNPAFFPDEVSPRPEKAGFLPRP
ncbi:Uncharacterized protein dnm_080980 [Desulfonema magnum]|uniref:Uncharacterized protein n=1 Tax=Desulfonema magnum TaxID=45655 RepID=A0A975GSG8_9BACT|nr:Uncharacterized protein dnm_080980 [Desulfonema magnum]